MKPEEYLDRLIEQRERGEVQLPVTNDEVAVSLASAEMLAQLQEIEVPPEFAGRLELSIRARARSLAQQNDRTIPIVGTLSGAPFNSYTAPQSPASSHHFPMRRALTVVLGIAAVLILAYTAILTDAARSLPENPLYGSKQAQHRSTLATASAQIDQLRSSLVDLSTLVNSGRNDGAIKIALDNVATKTNDSREAVATLPTGPEREAVQRDLDGVLAGEEQTLHHLLDHLDWPMQLAFTQQLGTLGDPVPTVTHVMMQTQSNGTLLITLTGAHFAPHAELIMDGRPGGMVSQSTAEQLAVVISNSAWSPGAHALGVLNPDGTAVQIVLNGDDNGPKQQNDDHNRYSTPGPSNNSDDGGE